VPVATARGAHPPPGGGGSAGARLLHNFIHNT